MINVITRTHNRPNFFKVCRESIESQKYHLNHVVTCQTDEDVEYVSQYEVNKIIRVPNVKKKSETIFEGGFKLKHAPYNTFLNYANESITDGWVVYLDDDDMLTPEFSEVLYDNISKFDANTKHFWKVDFGKFCIPSDEYFCNYKNGYPIKKGQFDMNGIMIHSSLLPHLKFDEWHLGDYRSFTTLEDKFPKRNMIDNVLTKLQSNQRCGLSLDRI